MEFHHFTDDSDMDESADELLQRVDAGHVDIHDDVELQMEAYDIVDELIESYRGRIVDEVVKRMRALYESRGGDFVLSAIDELERNMNNLKPPEE